MSMHNVCYLDGMYVHVRKPCFNVSSNGRRRHTHPSTSLMLAFLSFVQCVNLMSQINNDAIEKSTEKKRKQKRKDDVR